jgi:phosphoribosylformylglycinamidine synthase
MGLIQSAHDTSEGGLLVTVLESAFAGELGCALELTRNGLRLDGLLFGETAGRIVVSVEPEGAGSLEKLAATHRVPLTPLGTALGTRIRVQVDGATLVDLPASELKDLHASALELSLN